MTKHPELAKKLKLLYTMGANPTIKTNVDLARAVGLSKQAISRWTRGSETSRGNMIPHNQLPRLQALFDLPHHLFALPYEEFESRVRSKLDKEAELRLERPKQISVSSLPATAATLFGREKEIEALNYAWKSPRSNIVQIAAFGGVGKTSLVNSWLSAFAAQNYLDAEKIYAWSFYWQGNSNKAQSAGDCFVEHALEWFGDFQPSKGTAWSKAVRLARLVRQNKTLLILDGLEPLQRAPGANAGYIDNPAVAFLIKELTAQNNGLCVITTRVPVRDLSNFSGEERVVSISLANLPAAAAKETLSTYGVHGEERDFNAAIQHYQGHALSMSLLGGYLRTVHGGDIGRFREIRSLMEERELSSHTHKLMNDYLDWFGEPEQRELLFLLAIIDRITTLEDLFSISQFRQIAGLTENLAGLDKASWLYTLSFLEKANLVTCEIQQSGQVVSCHPLVRDFLCDYLSGEKSSVWIQGNQLLFDYLCSTAAELPADMMEAGPLFRAVIHGINANQIDQAFAVYYHRIRRQQFSIFSQGSHYEDQSCIRSFFKPGSGEPRDELPEVSRYLLLSCAATNFIYLGQINSAIEPARKSIEWYRSMEMWTEAAATAAPMVSMLIATGELTAAESLLDEIESCVTHTGNEIIGANLSAFRGYVKYLQGEDDVARNWFESADAVFTKLLPSAPVLSPTISSYYCKFLLDQGDVTAALERAVVMLAWRERKSWQVSVDTTSLYASDLLVLGLILLELGDLSNARIYLDWQVELFRSHDEWLYLPTGLHSRAKYFIRTEDFKLAIEDLEEALAIALKTGAKFGEWESYLNLAELYLAIGEYQKSREYLSRATSMTGMENYRIRGRDMEKLDKRLSTVANCDGGVIRISGDMV